MPHTLSTRLTDAQHERLERMHDLDAKVVGWGAPGGPVLLYPSGSLRCVHPSGEILVVGRDALRGYWR